jgi:hypothetical protein
MTARSIRSGLIPTLMAVGVLAGVSALPFYFFLVPAPVLPAGELSPDSQRVRNHPPRRVLLILLDGVGARVSFRPGSMPRLQQRIADGEAAWGVAIAPFPTLTPSGLRAMFTGRHGPPEAELPGGPRAREPDSVFMRAAAAGYRVVGVGQHDWSGMFANHGMSIDVIPYNGPGPDYDIDVFAKIKQVLSSPEGWDFAAVHFFGLDPYAHVHGTEGPEYAARLRRADFYVQELAKLAGPNAAVIVDSDHGQSTSGAHGGMAKSAREATFVAFGDGIKPGKVGTVALQDIAPTIAALLRIPPPVSAEGLPILPALRLSGKQRAELLSRTLDQRVQKWRQMRNSWSWIGPEPRGAEEVVGKYLDRGDWKKAGDTALQTVETMDSALETASPVRWFGRFVASLVLLSIACALAYIGSAPLSTGAQAAAAGLVAMFIGAVLAPIASSSVWPTAAFAAIAAGVCLLGVAVYSAARPDVLAGDWGAACFGLFGLAFPSVIDAPLWCACALLAVWLKRRPRSWSESGPWLVAGAALAIGCFVGPAESLNVGSALRALTPEVGSRMFQLPVLLRTAVWLTMGGCLWSSLAGVRRQARIVWTILGATPFALSIGPAEPGPITFAAVWATLLVSAAVAVSAPMNRRARALWLAGLALAAHSTLSFPPRGPRLAFAVIVGWGLARREEQRSAAWDGLELVSLSLWGYFVCGYSMDFSKISIRSVYEVVGEAHSVPTIAILVIGRQLTSLVAPILPRLAGIGSTELMTTMPLIGALSAGNLLELWTETLLNGRPMAALTQDELVARALWVVVLAWLVACVRLAIGASRLARAGMQASASLSPAELPT